MFAKHVGQRRKLRPRAIELFELDGRVRWRYLDGEWFVQSATGETMTLMHLPRSYIVEIPRDHVREFCHDRNGLGFFLLKSQLFVDRYEIGLEPILQAPNWFERELAFQCRRHATRLGLLNRVPVRRSSYMQLPAAQYGTPSQSPALSARQRRVARPRASIGNAWLRSPHS
jgi:hypothetical protein